MRPYLFAPPPRTASLSSRVEHSIDRSPKEILVRTYFVETEKFVAAVCVLFLAAVSVFAQQVDMNKKVGPSTIVPSIIGDRDMPVAGDNDLYCAGYVQSSPLATSSEIVGAENEKDQHVFYQGDALYINSGSSSGVSVGDMFSVVRPKGRVHTDWTRKGSLGFLVQEIGAVEVKRVMQDVSVVEVKTSCSTLLLGDLLQPTQQRTSPMFKYRGDLDRFGPSSGKASGRIFMARDNAEVLGQHMIVYVDLGSEDGLQVGDVLTVFRSLGTGNIFRKVLRESVDAKEDGYESDRYEGGHFSNQTARKKGSEAGGAVVTSENAKSRRPSNLRRIVGELMILNVKERTATAMIVKSTSEIHPGDEVEVK